MGPRRMITMAAIGGAGAAASYYAKDNYYTDREASEASAWAGQGAEAAGLSDEVDADVFKAVLEGRMPDGSVIPPGRNGVHTAGMDMTFSAPKSVSLLAYIGGDQRLLAANLAAVKETLAWAEKNLAETRISKDGKVSVEKTGKLVVALFQHDTNRNLDPQAHVHAVIANATQSKDGTWRALHNGKLWDSNTLLGAIYHAALREKVEALGYKVEMRGKYGTFEVAGIDRQAIETFSTRRVEILAAAQAADLKSTGLHSLEAMRVQTRQPKGVIEDRGDLRLEWQERAAAIGLDLAPLVDAARASGSDRPNLWDRLATGAANARERVRAVSDYVIDRLGLTPKELDPFMPDRSARLDPGGLGAATAVASALRHLSQREASFQTHAVYKAALELGLPVTIGGVEAAVTTLLDQNKLVAGSSGRDGEMTTPAALATERAIIAGALRDRSASPAIVANPTEAGTRLQAAAAARSGFELNMGQESAGRLILASNDRVVNIQGVAGAGKSSVLGAAADVARDAGFNVIGIGPSHKVREGFADAGIEAVTLAKFITSHKHMLSEKTFAERLDLAKAMFDKSIVVVDEASMVGNAQMRTLIDLANTLGFKLALVGDSRQLGAVDAGKPQEFLQATEVATATMTENLRARTAELQAAALLANEGRPAAALRRLDASVSEVPGRIVEEATARWIGKSDDDRARTILLASGRKTRDGLNAGVQAALLAEGKIGGNSATLSVRDNANLTREEERFARNYEVGQTIEFARDLKAQKIKAGEGLITAVDRANGRVEITRPDGTIDTLVPGRLAINRTENSIQLGTARPLTIHEGDRVRWTANDPARGLFNAGRATVTAITPDGVTFETATGMAVTLPRDDRQLGRVDLGYARNAHGNQGATSDLAIGVLDSRETNLTNARTFLVDITRSRDGLELVVDSRDRVAAAIERNRGDKMSALETVGEIKPLPRDADRTSAVANARAGRNAPAPAPERDLGPPVPVRERLPERQADFGL